VRLNPWRDTRVKDEPEDENGQPGGRKPTHLKNGRPLMPGANPPGVATYGDGHGHFYDNNGDEVPGSTGSEWLRNNNGGGRRWGE
jgi:hypothetical protein